MSDSVWCILIVSQTMQKLVLVGVFSNFFWKISVSWCQVDSGDVRPFLSESVGRILRVLGEMLGEFPPIS